MRRTAPEAASKSKPPQEGYSTAFRNPHRVSKLPGGFGQKVINPTEVTIYLDFALLLAAAEDAAAAQARTAATLSKPVSGKPRQRSIWKPPKERQQLFG